LLVSVFGSHWTFGHASSDGASVPSLFPKCPHPLPDGQPLPSSGPTPGTQVPLRKRIPRRPIDRRSPRRGRAFEWSWSDVLIRDEAICFVLDVISRGGRKTLFRYVGASLSSCLLPLLAPGRLPP